MDIKKLLSAYNSHEDFVVDEFINLIAKEMEMPVNQREKIDWLIDHQEIWIKTGDSSFTGNMQTVVQDITKGFQEAGLCVKSSYISDTSIIKMMNKARMIIRERRSLARR